MSLQQTIANTQRNGKKTHKMATSEAPFYLQQTTNEIVKQNKQPHFRQVMQQSELMPEM